MSQVPAAPQEGLVEKRIVLDVVAPTVADEAIEERGLEFRIVSSSRSVTLRPGLNELLVEPTEGRSSLELLAEGFWLAGGHVSLRKPLEGPLFLDVYALGAVVWQSGNPLPEEAMASLVAAVDGEVFGGPCDRKARAFECPVPVGRHWTRVDTDGFASVFRRVEVAEPGTAIDLGVVALVPEGGIVGAAVLSPSRPCGRCPVTIAHDSPLDEARAAGSGLEISLASRALETDAEGRLEVGNLSPGRYSLSVDGPGGETAYVPEIAVEPGKFAVIEEPIAVRLRPPLSFVAEPPAPVAMDPAAAAGNAEQVWTLLLTEVSLPGSRRFVLSEEIDPGGYWLGENLVPEGEYLARLVAPDRSVVWSQQFFHGAAGTEVAARVKKISVHGALSLGEEPLAARLVFKKGASVHRARSDDEGKFQVTLSSQGPWQLSVSGEGVERRMEVEIETDDDGDSRPLDIRLPDGVVLGRTLDEEGRLLPGALVHLELRQAESDEGEHPEILASESDDSGEFRFRGLPEGSYEISATFASETFGEMASATTGGVLDESIEVEELLILSQAAAFRGTVTGPSGPIAGAHLFVLPRPGGGRFPLTKQVGSDHAGRFTFEVPSNVTSVSAILMAIGYPLYVGTFHLADGEGTVYLEPRSGGSLAIEPGREALLDTVLMIDGTEVPRALLYRWAQMNGGSGRPGESLIIEQVPTGMYTICSGAGSLCREEYLAPGSRISIRSSSSE